MEAWLDVIKFAALSTAPAIRAWARAMAPQTSKVARFSLARAVALIVHNVAECMLPESGLGKGIFRILLFRLYLTHDRPSGDLAEQRT